MKLKRTLAFLLAVELLLTSLAACGKEEPAETKKPETDPKVETIAPDVNPEETEPVETEFDRTTVPDGLPEIKFNGKEMRFLVEDKDAYQLYAEEYTGEALNDVVFERNQRVEKRFDTKISTVSSLGMQAQDTLVSYAQVGEHIAEVCAFPQEKGNTPAIYLCWANWMDVPHLNFDQPWWNKEAMENHNLNNICYCLAGDLSLNSMQSAYCLAFNMDLMDNWGYPAEMLYNLVWDGEWTLDKMIEICSPLWIDENGDGAGNYGDKFGFGTAIVEREENENKLDGAVPWVVALGERGITIGDDGKSLHNTLGTEKMYSIIEKLVHFHRATVGAVSDSDISDFVAGNIGMYTAKLDHCYTHFNNLGFSYGILPLPKYDTMQDNYMTTPDWYFTMFGIPVTLPEEDYEFVGVLMEVLNAESWKTVYPAYYEEALKGRYATDPNMARMVDLITESRVYDYTVMVAQSNGTIPWIVNDCIKENDTDLASRLAQNDLAIKRTLAEILLLCYDIEDTTGILGVDYEVPDEEFGG